MDSNNTELIDTSNRFMKSTQEVVNGNFATKIEDFFENSKCGDIFVYQDGRFLFCCYFCGERITVYDEFTDHIVNAHSMLFKHDQDVVLENQIKLEDNPEVAESSRKTFYDISEVQQNGTSKLKAVKSEIKSKDNEANTLLECEKCGKSFQSRSGLARHRKFQNHPKEQKPKKEKPEPKERVKPTLNCQFCNRLFSRPIARQIHERIHTGERPIQCDECGRKFMCFADMTQHKIRLHLKLKRYECTVCKKKFVCTTSLKDHMATHSDARPISCTLCAATFPRRRALRHHMKLHSDVKEYVCKICGKEFRQSPGLYSHMKTHGVAAKKRPQESDNDT